MLLLGRDNYGKPLPLSSLGERAFALRYGPAIGASAAALILIILLVLFGSGAELAASIAGAATGVAGYLICASRLGPKRGRNN
jgi:hypothetical protein